MSKKVSILSISIEPSFYDAALLKKLGGMTYDEAKAFMSEFEETDTEDCAWSVIERKVDLSRENEMFFCCDGATQGDTSDTMFVYVKVTEDNEKPTINESLNKFTDASSNLIEAIESFAKQMVEVVGKNTIKFIKFDDEIDCATCSPIQFIQVNNDGMVVALDESGDVIGLDDLTGNELYEIGNKLYNHEYTTFNEEF